MAEEAAQQKLTQQQSELKSFGDDGIPQDENGWPLVQISCAASELVPTKQFSNVTIGPIVVKRYIKDGSDEYLLGEIHKTQSMCEKAVAEDRETVHNMIRQSEQGRLIP
jgi:hypothetical protein